MSINSSNNRLNNSSSNGVKRAIVVGAGLAGLSAGYRLHSQGWQVTVLESLDRVGGRVWTESENGFLFDLGPTLTFDSYREFMKLVADVGLSGELVDCPAQYMAVAKDGILHIIDTRKPLKTFFTTKLLPLTKKLRLLVRGARLSKSLRGLDTDNLGAPGGYDTESVDTFLARVLGRELLSDPFIGGMIGYMVPGDRSEASAAGFLAAAGTAGGKMQTLRGGLQRLPIEVAAHLDVRLNSPVTAVREYDGGVEVRYRDSSGSEHQEQVHACVIATPFNVAADIYPPLQGMGADLLNKWKGRSSCSVQVTYSKRTEKQPLMVIVPTAVLSEADSPSEAGALFLDHVKAPDRVPAGSSMITWLTPDVDRWSDDDLIATARQSIERLFPELHGHFHAARITRWEFTSNKAIVGYYSALQRFTDAYPADAPVQVAGDYMGLASQESAVAAGVKAAERIL